MEQFSNETMKPFNNLTMNQFNKPTNDSTITAEVKNIKIIFKKKYLSKSSRITEFEVRTGSEEVRRDSRITGFKAGSQD